MRKTSICNSYLVFVKITKKSVRYVIYVRCDLFVPLFNSFSIYIDISNNEGTVLSNSSIFETLWENAKPI